MLLCLPARLPRCLLACLLCLPACPAVRLCTLAYFTKALTAIRGVVATAAASRYNIQFVDCVLFGSYDEIVGVFVVRCGGGV